MDHFCYSVFAKILAKAAIRHEIKLPMAKSFIGSITSQKGVLQENGLTQYSINSMSACRWFDGEEQIPAEIQKASQDNKYREGIYESIEQFCFDNIYSEKLNSVCDEIYYKAESTPLASRAQKEKLRKSLDSKDKTEFLTDAFLLSLQQENLLERPKREQKQIDSFENDLDVIRFLKEQGVAKPAQIFPTHHSLDSEMGYVQALLEAYAAQEGIEVISEEELYQKKEYKEYQVNFKAERWSYYQAESVKEATRDSEIFNTEALSFEGFQQEIREGVERSFAVSYANGYFRMKKVTKEAEGLKVTTLLCCKLHWINPSVKHGTVHIIMNEENLSWNQDNDEQYKK